MTRWSTGHLALTAGLALAASGLADNVYVPLRDPHSLPERQDVLWRGDQKHPRRIEAAPQAEAPGVYQIQDLRWRFQALSESPARWQAIFTDARIDVSRVTGVSLVWSPFFPRKLAGHAAMLLHMDEGGVTRLGEAPGAAGLSSTDAGIVISVEARMRDGEEYSFFKGLKGEFPLVYSMSTLENYRQRCLDVYRSEMHSWRLALRPEEVRSVAEAAMDISLEDHRQAVYKLTRRSCSTEFMDILIEGLKRHQARTPEAARGETIEDLEGTLRRTRDADVDEVEREGQGVMANLKGFFAKLHPARWLGITRDHVRRTTPHGILVNPLMSLPAQLPGVLRRRDLLETAKPFEILRYQDPAAADQAQKQSAFRRLMGKLTD